jgi:long-subunit fatty acid transport protein
MKKIVLLIISFFAISTNVDAQIRFGGTGGLTLVSQSITNTAGVSPSTKGKLIASNVGFLMEAPFANKFAIQAGLSYNPKGVKTTLGSTESNISLDYLEIPINVFYKVTDKFSVGAGPYVAYALGGGSVVNGKDVAVKFGTGENKRLDFGVGFTAGYEVAKGSIISLNYSLGLIDISDNSNVSIKNRGIGISYIFFFGKNN